MKVPQLQFLNEVVDVPDAQVVQDFPIVTQKLFSMVSLTIEIPQFSPTSSVVLVVRVHRCRLVKTVALPRLHSSRNSMS